MPVGIVIPDRRDEQVEERPVGRRLDRGAEDDQLDVTGGRELGPEPLDELGAHRRLGRPRQDAAVDLDDGVARDDVVLDPGMDDVRADRVAQQRPDGAGVHRVAGDREGRLGAAGVVAATGARRTWPRLGRQFGRGELEERAP